MKHTPFTEKTGPDSARSYIDKFHTRTQGHRRLRISEENGTGMGFLMVSKVLNDRIRAAGERIMVDAEDLCHSHFQPAP